MLVINNNNHLSFCSCLPLPLTQRERKILEETNPMLQNSGLSQSRSAENILNENPYQVIDRPPPPPKPALPQNFRTILHCKRYQLY